MKCSTFLKGHLQDGIVVRQGEGDKEVIPIYKPLPPSGRDISIDVHTGTTRVHEAHPIRVANGAFALASCSHIQGEDRQLLRVICEESGSWDAVRGYPEILGYRQEPSEDNVLIISPDTILKVSGNQSCLLGLSLKGELFIRTEEEYAAQEQKKWEKSRNHNKIDNDIYWL